jgi:hypothetical protein
MVHPQKRIFIKRMLESTILRICEMKKDMVIFNPRPGSMYIHLDQLLFDLKYDPSILEIPVPRYFKEDDRLPIDLDFKEKVERDADDGDKKKEPPPMSLDEKTKLMDKLQETYYGTAEPEVEIVHDPFTLDMDIVSAIRLIQKNERGR